MESLKNTLENYKNNTYEFGRHTSEQEIKKAIANKKIFVLDGGITRSTLFTLLIFYSIAFFSIISGISSNDHVILILTLIVSLILLGFGTSIFFIQHEGFLVIGQSGIYCKSIKKEVHIPWSDIKKMHKKKRKNLLGEIHLVVSCSLKNGEKYTFNASNYKRKEFPKNKYPELFGSLFEIFWHTTMSLD